MATAPAGARYPTLDIVRGVAVIGILVINILSFALPPAARADPTAGGGLAPADLAVWAIDWVLFESKMRGLFSLLFGASLLVVADRARTAGRRARAVQLPRLLVLLLLGAAHHLLIWSGDILVLYAVVGLAALPFTRAEPPALRRASLAAFALSFALFALAGLGQFAASRGAHAVRAPASPLDVHAVAWTEEVAARADGFLGDQLVEVIAFFPDTLGLMLLGMALLRSGLLTGGWGRRRALRLAGVAGLAGASPLAAIVAWLWASGWPRGWLELAFWTLSYPFNIVLTLAWAAGLSAWASAASGWLPRALEATGRMAFSNYIGTSLVMTTLFYGYGFGLFGEVSRADTVLFVAAGAALMLGWSRPWLTRFRYGPLEWLWRSLARGRLQPMRPPALAAA